MCTIRRGNGLKTVFNLSRPRYFGFRQEDMTSRFVWTVCNNINSPCGNSQSRDTLKRHPKDILNWPPKNSNFTIRSLLCLFRVFVQSISLFSVFEHVGFKVSHSASFDFMTLRTNISFIEDKIEQSEACCTFYDVTSG